MYRLIAPLLALALTVPVLLVSFDYLAALLPVWALAGYIYWRQQSPLPSGQLLIGLIVLLLIVVGMVWGPLASSPPLNRLAHGLIAGGLAFGLAHELAPGRRRVVLLAIALTMVFGLALEIFEALIDPDSSAKRLYDSGADLGADLIGAIVGALLWRRS